MMGLLEALRRYGGEPDEQFESYAFKRIRGAMLDELRRPGLAAAADPAAGARLQRRRPQTL